MADDASLQYCVVANVARETTQGPGRLEIRSGVRHFAAGAKVWVLPPQWDDDYEKTFVVGRHRGGNGRYVRLVMSWRHLENFRVQAVYSPALLRTMTRPWWKVPLTGWSGSPWSWQSAEQPEPQLLLQWPSREDAEGVAMDWNVRTAR